MKKILVTGGAGYIGSHTVKELLKEGIEVIVYDNLSNGSRELVLKPAKLIVGDILDREKLKEVFRKFKPEAIIHFAALIEAGESERKMREYIENNILGTLNLLEETIRNQIEFFIFSSSAAVYGEPEDIPIKEDHRLKPVNFYGLTKMVIEEALRRCYSFYNLKYISLRYFNAAGADPDGELGEIHEPETHIIPNVLKTALGKRPYFEIFGNDYDTHDGTCIRDYIHVTDLARAHVLALEHLKKKKESDIFNLGTEKGISNLEILNKASEITGKKIKIKFKERRVGDPEKLIASSQKARKILGWKPQYSDLDTIIKTAWNWHKKNG